MIALVHRWQDRTGNRATRASGRVPRGAPWKARRPRRRITRYTIIEEIE
jgi:hypothetical protein